MIAPVEKILGIIQPAREDIGEQRHFLLVELRAPVGAGHLVDGRLDADLREAFLNEHAQRFVDSREAEIERQRCFKAVGIARLDQQGLRLGHVRIELVRLRPRNLRGLVRRRAKHGLRQAKKHGIHDFLIGHGIGDRLPQLLVVHEDAHLEPEPQIGERHRFLKNEKRQFGGNQRRSGLRKPASPTNALI